MTTCAPSPSRIQDRTFLTFCRKIRVELEAGQLVYAKVAFDGIHPKDLPPNERQLAREIFGDIEEIPHRVRRVVCAVFGGRGGKTFVGALRGVHLGLTVPLDKLARGQCARVWFVAPEKDLASEAMAYVKGVFEHPKLRKLVVQESTEKLLIRRKDGKRVLFEIKAAKGKGLSTRGRVIVFALLDEAAFFQGADHVVNDIQIYQAIQPRVSIHGQTLIQSTPWTETGLLYDFYRHNWGAPDKCLAAYASTRTMRSDPEILQQVDEAYDLDEENAEREFGAKFLSAAAITWFDPKELEAAVDKSLTADAPRAPRPGDFIGVGGDLAFSKNSSAISAAHRPANDTDEPGDHVTLAEVCERRPTPDKKLEPSQVCTEFVGFIKRHRGAALVCDGHYRESAREALDKAGLLIRHAPRDTTLPWVTMRNLLRQGALTLPDDKQLLKELKSIRWAALRGGRVQIRLPETKDGRHCDLAQSAALAIDAVWREPCDRVPPEPKPRTPRDEQLEALRHPKPGRHWSERQGGRRAA